MQTNIARENGLPKLSMNLFELLRCDVWCYVINNLANRELQDTRHINSFLYYYTSIIFIMLSTCKSQFISAIIIM